MMVKIIDGFGAEKILSALRGMPKEEEADLVVSTAHKSKGRQWSKVKLAPDFPPKNKSDDSDKKLLYVACTRAMHELDITECSFFTGRERQPVEALPLPPVASPASNTMTPPLTKSVNARGNGEFTWCKSKTDEAWLVRGPSGRVGDVVDVSRKDGSISKRQLLSVEREFDDATLYRVD